MHKGKKVIIGIDKGYQLSSVVDKLGAFYGFLKLYPYWSNKVISIINPMNKYIMIANSSHIGHIDTGNIAV